MKAYERALYFVFKKIIFIYAICSFFRMKAKYFFSHLTQNQRMVSECRSDIFRQLLFNSAYYTLMHEKMIAEKDTTPRTVNNFYERKLKEIGKVNNVFQKATLSFMNNSEVAKQMIGHIKDALFDEINGEFKNFDELTLKYRDRILAASNVKYPASK